MRELHEDELNDTLKKVTEGTAMMAMGILAVQRHDLMQRLLDITTETLSALGVESNYSVKDIMEGLNEADRILPDSTT